MICAWKELLAVLVDRNGAGVTVAHNLGGRQDAAVHKTVHSALLIALVSGIVLTIIGVLFSGNFLQMMGTDKDILQLSTSYMQIYFGGITFTMVYNFCAAILRAAGDTKSPLFFLLIAGVVNVVLNVVFITIFKIFCYIIICKWSLSLCNISCCFNFSIFISCYNHCIFI